MGTGKRGPTLRFLELLWDYDQVVFGATKLPALGDGLGKAIMNFKKSIDTDTHDEPKGKIESPNKSE